MNIYIKYKKYANLNLLLLYINSIHIYENVHDARLRHGHARRQRHPHSNQGASLNAPLVLRSKDKVKVILKVYTPAVKSVCPPRAP